MSSRMIRAPEVFVGRPDCRSGKLPRLVGREPGHVIVQGPNKATTWSYLKRNELREKKDRKRLEVGDRRADGTRVTHVRGLQRAPYREHFMKCLTCQTVPGGCNKFK